MFSATAPAVKKTLVVRPLLASGMYYSPVWGRAEILGKGVVGLINFFFFCNFPLNCN